MRKNETTTIGVNIGHSDKSSELVSQMKELLKQIDRMDMVQQAPEALVAMFHFMERESQISATVHDCIFYGSGVSRTLPKPKKGKR